MAEESISISDQEMKESLGDPHIPYLPGSFRNWLPSGCEGNRVVNWMAVFGQRVRELFARGDLGDREARATRALCRSRWSNAESPPPRKPLWLLAETKEPRRGGLSGSCVNWSVRQFRNRNSSSPNATLFITTLSYWLGAV